MVFQKNTKSMYQFFYFYKTFITMLLVYKADVAIAELLFVELLHSLLSLDDVLIITQCPISNNLFLIHVLR